MMSKSKPVPAEPAAPPADPWKAKRAPLFGILPRLPNWATNSRSNVFGTATHKPGAFLRAMTTNFKSIFGRRDVRRESFDDAIKRLELSEDDLLVRRGSLVVGSRMAYASGVLLLLICGYFAYHAMLLQVCAAAAMFCFCAVSGLVRAFRAWQIQIRRLAPFSEFLKTSEVWIV